MIECYFSACPRHSAHPYRPDGDYDGPFCEFNSDCTATVEQQLMYAAVRKSQFVTKELFFMDGAYWYERDGTMFVGGKIDLTNKTVTVGFHEGVTYIQYVTEVDRDDITLQMYLRQMMMILHCYDIESQESN